MIIATCGHVDHGKTTLVKALTGVDTDRLPEEKRRGMTIEPGYACWSPDGKIIAGFVDVPGHEKFLRNMIAGCCGADIALLVVDVNEGVKLQTLEHVAIMNMLKISAAVVVLTKCTGVSYKEIEKCTAKIREAIGGIFSIAPVVCIDSITRSGLDQLAETVIGIAASLPERLTDSDVALWVDRKFNKKGYGTIVTGTLSAGRITVGDNLLMLPQNCRVRVRGIQSYGVSCRFVTAGSRVALNLATDISGGRGTFLCHTGVGAHTADKCLIGAYDGIKGGAVRFYTGTAEISGRIKKTKINKSQHWIFTAEHEFPVVAGNMALLRPLNRREVIDAVQIQPIAFETGELPECTDKKNTPDEPAKEISVGNVRYSAERYTLFLELLRGHFSVNRTLTLARFRDLTGLGREQAKNMLEHFDTQKFTVRAGNLRYPLSRLFPDKADK